MRVRGVPREALGTLSGDWIDRLRRVYVDGSTAWVAVRDGFAADREIPERCAYRGRGFQMVGNIALVRGNRPAGREVEEIVRFRRPDGVLWLKGFLGVERIPDVEVLYGTAGDVPHRESGITYWLDPSQVMFSQGNRLEKVRVANLIRPGERVADMCAGIGYFTIPVARAGATVDAIEINPVAFRYLCRNIAVNRVGGQVTPMQGDSRTLLSGKYDRIVIGHFSGPDLFPSTLGHVRTGTIVHVHSTGAEPPILLGVCGSAGYGASIETRRVKRYSPHAWHYVQDITIL